MKKAITQVTDHAVLRYMERVMGVDVGSVRNEIGRRVDLIKDHPDASAVVSEGFCYRVVEGKVVTVVKHNQPSRRFGRHATKGDSDA